MQMGPRSEALRMIESRTLRPYPTFLFAVIVAVVIAICCARYDPSLVVPVLCVSFLVIAGSSLHQRIVLVQGAIQLHQAGESTLIVPTAAVSRLTFTGKELAIMTVDGVAITMTTPWYSGRQRDAVIAHLQASQASDSVR